MSELTTLTLRKAHSLAENLRMLGHPIPLGIALLELDYWAWRKRVQRGVQVA
jgi:hypothetical protein